MPAPARETLAEEGRCRAAGRSPEEQKKADAEADERARAEYTVSYTHLTLPTILRV